MPPTHDDIYAQLIAALHPSPPVTLEIEILPSSFPPELLLDASAIGVPKSLLVPLFLKARQTFFGHLSPPNDDDDDNDGTDDSYRAALQATAVILLFDPNHITAANFRKRHIQRYSDGDDGYYDDREDAAAEGLATGASWRELKFLESLVTSPLSKHAKSPTLWAQRLWVVRNCSLVQQQRGKEIVVVREEHSADDYDDEEETTAQMTGDIRRFWERELTIVMKAGERHAGNYHAWQYARELSSLVQSHCSEMVGEGVRLCAGERLRQSVVQVRKWCLMHPRDISGLAFLAFLLEQLRDEISEGGSHGEMGQEARTCVLEIQKFARNFEWKGESIEWLLRAMRKLNCDH